MPRFITIGYGDQEGYDRTPQRIRDAAHQQDANLRSQGTVMGIAGAPVQVRNPEARGIETVDGPFMSSAFPVAGFAIIEADDRPPQSKRSRASHAPSRTEWSKSGR